VGGFFDDRMRFVLAFQEKNFEIISKLVLIGLIFFVLAGCGLFNNLILVTGGTPQDQSVQDERLMETGTTPVFLPSVLSPKDFNPTSFGVLAVIPGSSGSTSDPAAVAAVADLGTRYMRVSLDWAISEPEPGQLSFATRNDEIIQRIERSGLRMFPTLYVGSGWMNGSPPAAMKRKPLLPTRRPGGSMERTVRLQPELL
jgi:hypothetical protein